MDDRRSDAEESIRVDVIYKKNVMDREPVLRKTNEAMLLIVKKCIRYKPKEISPSFIKQGLKKS
jgi:hypothetical protein